GRGARVVTSQRRPSRCRCNDVYPKGDRPHVYPRPGQADARAAGDGRAVGSAPEGGVPGQGRARLLRHDGRQPLRQAFALGETPEGARRGPPCRPPRGRYEAVMQGAPLTDAFEQLAKAAAEGLSGRGAGLACQSRPKPTGSLPMRVLGLWVGAVLAPLASLAADEKAEPKPALSVEAEVASNDRIGKHLVVRLVNVGKTPLTVVTGKLQQINTGQAPLAVVTNGLRSKASGEGDKLTGTLDMTEQTKLRGRLVVPPADSLGLVKLMPGEVANVSVPAMPRVMNKLGAKAEVTVVYEVSAFWGKRFGAWHGKAECKVEAGK